MRVPFSMVVTGLLFGAVVWVGQPSKPTTLSDLLAPKPGVEESLARLGEFVAFSGEKASVTHLRAALTRTVEAPLCLGGKEFVFHAYRQLEAAERYAGEGRSMGASSHAATGLRLLELYRSYCELLTTEA